ncbi:MAG: PHP domain-containing protein [Candidatus Omnitrophota bacterium]|jgi:predicted metal-dependent phosphoesterase TrpH|nr:PHP domain-containing protein [Candidatus Omnitrophota bacterium]
MSKWADLHIHTFYSDSTSSPQEVIQQAIDQGLSCIAIADHDTVDGIAPTIEAAKEFGIEVIPAIELSAELNGKDIHILAYLFDYQNEELNRQLEIMQNARIQRMEQMIDKLKQLGFGNISLEEVCGLVHSKAVGRPHLALVLKQKGYVTSLQEAFDRFLADGAAAYVPKFKQTPQEAIELIKKYGGVTVLAHPMVTGVDELIAQFAKWGLGGLEAFYPNTPAKLSEFYCNLASKHQMVVTGGSDAHGAAKKHTFVGRVKIPYDLVEKLKQSVPTHA